MADQAVQHALGLRVAGAGELCQDAAGWNDGALCAYEEGGRRSEMCQPLPGAAWPASLGWTCRAYEEKGRCRAGEASSGAHMGALWRYPERHCCACGGGRRIRDEGAAGAEAAAAPRPLCFTDTGGSCHLAPCHAFRGATTCRAGRCLCMPGYCADSSGTCYRNNGFVAAKVAPVSRAHPAFPEDHGRVATGVAVSGGGSRSLACALGQLRALHGLGLLEGLDALSSVSGGSWASAIYTFADMEAEELLGAPSEPSRLTMEELGGDPPPLGRAGTAWTSTTALRLKAAGVYLKMLWIQTVAEAILAPFGLGRMDAFMAASEAAVEEIRRRNPQLAEETFLVPRPRRPRTLILTATIEAPEGYQASEDSAVSLQMSPDYAGSPFYPNDTTVSYRAAHGYARPPLRHVLVGGGFVEALPLPVVSNSVSGTLVNFIIMMMMIIIITIVIIIITILLLLLIIIITRPSPSAASSRRTARAGTASCTARRPWRR